MDITEAICIAVLIGIALGVATAGFAVVVAKLLKRERESLPAIDVTRLDSAEPYPRVWE